MMNWLCGRKKASTEKAQVAAEEAQVAAIAAGKSTGTWGGMVAPPAAMNSALGVPHWLAKYGLASWMLIGLGIVIVAIAWILGAVTEVFLGVFLSFVLTAVLYPIVSWLSKYMPRTAATALAMLFGFIVFGGMVSYVVYSVANEWDSLANQFQDGVNSILDFFTRDNLPWHLSRQDLSEAISNAVSTGTDWIQSNAGTIAQTVLANASNFAVVMTILALSLFVTFFFLAQGPQMWLWFLNLLPARNRYRSHLGATAGWVAFSGYARGTVIISIINGILAFIFLSIVGVPLSAPLAVLVLIGTFIPLVGAPAAMVVAMIVALASGGLVKFIVVGVGIAGIGQIEGHLLQPLIMGRQVALHPIVVAIGVAAGGFAGGLVGAVIAIPLMAIAWSVYRTLRQGDEEMTELPDIPQEKVLPEED
ncbi:AI-2E family transporter [Trueperella bernardiae]|uniref:AI-2E family transporter n=1 Tax=Trueperella bernardiae TaxID=59561 RepID=UPI002948DFA4|nr:AI-2E family transporter [Trueperella bernardiae]MDV6239538.1 AI-2E family transporter [Trueperella bernardiae]